MCKRYFQIIRNHWLHLSVSKFDQQIRNNKTGEKNSKKMFVIKFLSVFLFYILTNNVVESSNNIQSIMCRTNMTSTCSSYKVTKWNKRNVGRHLKEWIKSISIEWKFDEMFLDEASHCKAFIIKKNEFFYKYAPDVISSDVIILAKIMHQSNVEKSNIKISESPKLHGPSWVDLNNRNEWEIEQHPHRVTARLLKDAVLANGLYYGELSSDDMKLGE